jgi:hypothetical protein
VDDFCHFDGALAFGNGQLLYLGRIHSPLIGCCDRGDVGPCHSRSDPGMRKKMIATLLTACLLAFFGACDRKTTIVREESTVNPPISEQPKVNLEIKGSDSGVDVDTQKK